MRYGEKESPQPTIRRASETEVEFVNAGNSEAEIQQEERRLTKTGRKAFRHVDKLSDAQIDAATDRVIMGESVARLAEELMVSKHALAKRIKARCGLLYMRKWQQSVSFDCLRA